MVTQPGSRWDLRHGGSLSQSALHYLQGQGDLVNRLIIPIIHIVTPMIPVTSLHTKSL